MRSNLVLAAAFARIVAASPAPNPIPQNFDYAAVLDAPAPSVTGPPISYVANTTTTVNSASVSASIAADVVSVASASITGAAASAAASSSLASAQTAIVTTAVHKRDLVGGILGLFGIGSGNGNGGWGATTTSTSSSKSSSATSSTSLKTSTSSTSLTTSTSSTSLKTSTSSTSSIKSSSSTSSAQPSTSSTPSTTTQQSTTSTTTTSSTACATSIEAGTYCGFINPEDPCAVQPDGYGPKVTPDTVAAFYDYSAFKEDALSAVTPAGYVNTFRDLNASSSANSYITFYTLTSYNVSGCAALCDSTSTCTAFNIYIERDPSLNPNTNATDAAYNCPDPSSITNYKCSLWGSDLDSTTATNTGDWRDEFQVVITASNGYDKSNTTTPATVGGYNSPTNCSGKAISSGGSYWMGSTFYPGPYDPSLCAAYANAQTAYNKAAAQANGAHSYTPCNMFNAYYVYQNGLPQGTYCALFDTPLNPSWAGFVGGWINNAFFGVRSSWTYQLTTQDPGTC